MDKYFALINNNLVEDIIVGSDEFISSITDQYQHVIDVTERIRPSPGFSYYHASDSFVDNSIINPPIVVACPGIPDGSQESFEPFNLSTYSVSYDSGIVSIGCKRYEALGLRNVLYNLLIDHCDVISEFCAEELGPAHGKFGITWDDAQAVYDALKELRLM